MDAAYVQRIEDVENQDQFLVDLAEAEIRATSFLGVERKTGTHENETVMEENGDLYADVGMAVVGARGQ